MKKLPLLAVLLFCTAALSTAQKRYDNINYPELNKFNEPDVTTFTTDNGIKFYLVEDHELPLIDLSMTLRAGSVLIPKNKTGLASLTGQVMRSGGTESIPADSLNEMLENKAASMNTYIGFSSGGAGMNVLKEDFDTLLPVFIDLLQHPAFPQEKIDLAKTQAKTSISRRNDNAGSIANREFEKLVYGPSSKYSQITEYETINNISRDDMVAFHQQYFSGQNMMIGVVGDFDTAEMRNKLEAAFGDVAAGEATDLNFPEVDYNFEQTINLADKPDLNQSTVLMGHIGGMRDNPDYAKVQVMNNVLSGGFSGRLFQKVRTDLGLAYSVGGSYGMNTFYPGEFTVSVQTKTGTTAEAIDAIMGEIERLQNEPISEEELQDTKDQFLNSLVFRNTSYSQILNRRINNEYYGRPEDSFEQFVEGVKNTSTDDVQQMAQKYLHPNEMQILVVGNKAELGDQLQKYGKVNELDISIPQPGENEQKQVQGDAQKGRAMLGAMADKIITPGTTVNTVSVSGEVSINQMGQTQKLPVSTVIDYPDAVVQNITTPRGDMTVSYKNGQGRMSMAGQERSLPANSPMVTGLKSTLNRNVISIAMKADSLNPQFTGTEMVDGTQYNVVNVNVAGKSVDLLINGQTNLPIMSRYQEFNAQQGEQMMVEDRYSNWNTVGGVTYPYTQVSMVDGEENTRAEYESHQVNNADAEN